MKIYEVITHPYALLNGTIEVPDSVPESEVHEYIEHNWWKVKFEEPELDYAGTDFETVLVGNVKQFKVHTADGKDLIATSVERVGNKAGNGYRITTEVNGHEAVIFYKTEEILDIIQIKG